MQLLRLALILLLSPQLLITKESETIEISEKNNYTRNQSIDGFKTALRSLGIDPEVRGIERILADYSSTADKRNFLEKLVMSAEGSAQFQKKNGRKPTNSDVESAYEVLLGHYETVAQKVCVAAENETIEGGLKAISNGNIASQLLYSATHGYNNLKSGCSHDLTHAHHHGHNHRHSEGEDGLSSAHKCSHGHGSHEHHNHHHNHHHDHTRASGSVDVVIGCACSQCG